MLDAPISQRVRLLWVISGLSCARGECPISATSGHAIKQRRRLRWNSASRSGALRIFRNASASLSARATQASALPLALSPASGISSKTTMSTGSPSMASKSMPWRRRAKSANGALRLGSRAWGSATPLPTPVDPSSSRLAISRTTSSAAKPVSAAASVESCSKQAPLVARLDIDHDLSGREKIADLHYCSSLHSRVGRGGTFQSGAFSR